jgi:Tol biopolymer transport system component
MPGRSTRAALSSLVFAWLFVSASSGVAGLAQPAAVMSPLGGSASQYASLSGDGRFMAFGSHASNLVPGDANGFEVFVFDREDSSVERVAVTSGGAQSLTGVSNGPSISDDGRYVAFYSDGNDLVPADVNNAMDVFLRDLQAGTTTRISLDSTGTPGNGASYAPAISGDGTVVAFQSDATNLVADDTNDVTDVFVRDLVANTTTRVSVATGGTEGTGGGEMFDPWVPALALSNDGRYIFFASQKTDLVASDTNGVADVFRHDRQTGTTIRVSVSSGGGQGNGASVTPSASGDGSLVAFTSNAFNLVAGDTNGFDVFVHDVNTGQTSRVSVINHGGEATQDSANPSISADGRYVAFQSFDNLLVPADTNLSWDIFIRDRETATLKRVSVAADGGQGNANSHYPSLSDDGAFVGYLSWSWTLVSNDTNFTHDVFVADWQALGVLEPPDVVQNGTFAGGVDGSGFPVNWLRFALPLGQADAWWNMTGDTLNFQRPPGSTQNVVFQQTNAGFLPRTAVVATFSLANTAPIRKRISILVHESDFTDLHVCTFWLEPNAPMRVYRMRTHTTRRWFNATVSFYAATVDATGFYQLDDVSLAVDPDGSDWRTGCEDPTAPAPPSGAASGNLISNGDFGAPLPPWGTFGSIVHQIAGGVFEFYRPDPLPTPAGVVLQPTGQAMLPGQIMTATFALGNSTTLRRRVTLLLHDGDFLDLSACTFWLEPGAPLSTYTARMTTTKAWTNATFSLYAASVGPEQWMRLDDVVLEQTPLVQNVGTECVAPEPQPELANPQFRAGLARR